ncbi:hypothetical protein HYE68_010019 [Fusarium pseudograminearum]|nr:hypothetical protein HYE68_010019 [Fusarium pseudograminearum]
MGHLHIRTSREVYNTRRRWITGSTDLREPGSVIFEKIHDLKVDVEPDASSKRTNVIAGSSDTTELQVESFQKHKPSKHVQGHRSSTSKRKSKSKVTKSAKYLPTRKRDPREDALVIRLTNRCKKLQKARLKLESEKQDAHFAASKLRRKLEKKQKKLSKVRLLSEGKDLEIDLLREGINTIEQELKSSSRGNFDGSSEDCQGIGTGLQLCAKPIAECHSQNSDQATPNNGSYKTADLWSQEYGATTGNSSFWNGSKTAPSIKSEPYQMFDHGGRKDLLCLKTNSAQKSSRCTTESESPIDSLESGSPIDISSDDDVVVRTSRRPLRNTKKVNYDVGAPEHWPIEFFN